MADPQIIPLAATPSQTLSITLGNQSCKIDVYTKHIQVPTHSPGTIATDPPVYEAIDPIFLDLYVNDALVLGGVLGLNNVKIVRGFCAVGSVFVGDLSFTDTQANDDPDVSGLGGRWQLLYWPDL